jgi:hypothetical protein
VPYLPIETINFIYTKGINMITGISGSETNPLQGNAGRPVLSRAASPAAPAPTAEIPAAKVSEQPAVRADQVDRAKQLLSSPNYPPRAIVEAVAKLIADSQPE